MVATPYVNHLNAQKHCTEPKLTKHCGLRAGRQKEQKKRHIALFCTVWKRVTVVALCVCVSQFVAVRIRR